MESLYRKYRPLTFESVVGQQHIVSTLEHAITEGRLSHAYLFCGPRGTGKTTMARIVAKALLCERAAGARAAGASGCMPDGSCEECQRIAEGTHPDVYELDAASRTGVDNVREEIINSVSFAPVRGAYKIYIIDEVHMLTTQAFNALLKTLEEPPEHVVFVLCTTDPQKIPETILSRCQRFDFHRIGNEDIVGRLRYICEQEGFDYDAEALEIVAKHARGGMRDALSTLEQLSVFGNGSVHAADARALLGEVSGTVLSEFSRAIAARDVATLFGLVRAQVDTGEDLMELTRDLVAHVRDIYMVRVAGARPELFDGGEEDVSALAEESGLFETADRLARVLTVLDDAALEMRSAADTRLVLEIALTRLARPESDLSLEALAERVDRLEVRIASGVPAAPLNAQGVATLTGAAGQAATHDVAAASAARAAVDAAAGTGQGVGSSQVETRGDRGRSAQAAPSRTTTRTQQGSAAASETAAHVAEPPRRDPVERVTASKPVSQAARAATGTLGATAAVPQAAPVQPSAAASQTAPARPSAAVVAASAAASTPPVTDPGDLQRKWADVVKRVTAAQASRGALLQASRAQSDDGTALTVSFPAGSGFAITMLGRPDTQAIVLPQVCAVFGNRSVHYVMDDGASKPAAATSAPAAPAAAPAAAAPVAAPSTAPAAVPPASAAASSAAAAAPSKPAAAEPTSRSVPAAATPAPVSASATATPSPVSAPAPAPEPRSVPAPAWDDDQVPYGDAAAISYDEDDLPPFDMPAASVAPAAPSAVSAAAPVNSPTSSSAPASAPVPVAAPVGAPGSSAATPAPDQSAVSTRPATQPQPEASAQTPWGTVPGAATDGPAAAGNDGEATSPEDVASILGTVFGSGVKLTPVDGTE